MEQYWNSTGCRILSSILVVAALGCGGQSSTGGIATPDISDAESVDSTIPTSDGGSLPSGDEGTGQQRVLSVVLDGDGAGRVVSTPPGIDCGTSCSASFSTRAVALKATPADGSVSKVLRVAQ